MDGFEGFYWTGEDVRGSLTVTSVREREMVKRS